MRFTAIDLFAGAGGMTLGLRKAGFDVRVAVDFDPFKAATLQANHPKTTILGVLGTSGDVRRINGKELLSIGGLRKGSLDLLVGCPPCQGFSLQGNRNPKDERNGLYLEYVRLIKEIKPRAIVFENVPGILNLKEGEIFSDLNERIEKMGYITNAWILDAQRLGIPQTRKRIFLVGTCGEINPRAPIERDRTIGVWEAIADLPCRKIKNIEHATSISMPYRSGPRGTYAKKLRGSRSTVMNCEATTHAKHLLRRISNLKWNEKDEATWHRRLHPKEPSHTITAGSRTRTACRPIHPYADRVLTVREGARLASFPDWYKLPDHKAEAWSQIGNCVPPLMAQRVLAEVRKCL